MTYTDRDKELLRSALTKSVGSAKATEYLNKLARGEELTWLEKRQIAESRPERPISQQEAQAMSDALGITLPSAGGGGKT